MSESTRQELQTFTASLVHELRTPLSALSGEVELALRRDRSPAAYRATLMRVAQQATELVDLTGDLALLGDPEGFKALSKATADLGALATHLSMRYDPGQVVVAIDPQPGMRVVGHELLLTRAFRLVLDHALRYQGHGSPVVLHTAAQGAQDPTDHVALILDATDPGFSRRTWHYLTDDEPDPELMGSPGLLPLRTASSIVRLAGGTLTVDGAEGSVCVRIRLRQVPLGASETVGA